MIDYSPLWDTLKERGITQYYLLKNGIDNKTLDSLKKNKNITMLTLEKLCTIIGCMPNDVVRFIKELPELELNPCIRFFYAHICRFIFSAVCIFAHRVCGRSKTCMVPPPLKCTSVPLSAGIIFCT